MAGKKIVLKGLRHEDYIHPEEKFFNDKNPGKFSLIKQGMDFLNDVSIKFVRQITEGKWVEINRKTASDVFDVVYDVCKILDYPNMPRLFVRHEHSMHIIIGGTDYSQMLIPDYILNEFDLQMQYFVIGNAITMFKSNHVQLATICSVMCGGVMTAPVRLALQAYLRAADLSSDRGGLLSCQDFSAAARCILAEIGLPPSETRFLDEKEILALVENCLQEMSYGSFDNLMNAAAEYKKVTGDQAPPAIRLQELFNWYRDGYADTLSEVERRCAQ